MNTDHLNETSETAFGWRGLSLYASVATAALAAYTGLLYFVLSRSTAKVYGFAVSYDPRTLIELAVQICPMLAAIFMVLLSRVRDSVIGSVAQQLLVVRPRWSSQTARTVSTVAANVAIAVITAGATALAIRIVYGPLGGSLGAITSLWVAAELIFDFTLIGIFTTALYALTRRSWMSMLLFIAYIFAVVFAGPRWGITSYIGFGSGVPIMLTTYSAIPLYDGAGWLFRGYWTCVTLVMLYILHEFDVPEASLLRNIQELLKGGQRRFRKPICVTLTLVAVCIVAAASLVRLQQYGRAKYESPSQSALDAALRADKADPHARLHLSHFDVRLKYASAKKTIAVEGAQTFRAESQPIQTAYFQMPDTFVPERLQIEGAGKYEIRPLGKYIQVAFENSIQPGAQARVRYAGSIRSAGPLDLAVEAKVLADAFFLTDSDIMLTARSAACLIAADDQNGTKTATSRCGNGENFLLTDLAIGRTTVITPRSLEVLTAGVQSDRRVAGDEVEHVFTTSSPRLARFQVACGRFSKRVLESKDGQAKVQVYRAEGASGGDVQANVAQSVLSFYKTFWTEFSGKQLHIVETPTPAGEAVAFEGVIAISDKIIASRNPTSGSASGLLEFVMAHEIAHQWWGYRLIPARSPGWRFVLESFPQFAAYKYLSHRGILKEADAMRNEKRRYEAAHSRRRDTELPLLQVEAADELAYNKGPLALLTVDDLLGGRLMARLGVLLDNGSNENTAPEDVVTGLLEQLPIAQKEAALPLFYSPGFQR